MCAMYMYAYTYNETTSQDDLEITEAEYYKYSIYRVISYAVHV